MSVERIIFVNSSGKPTGQVGEKLDSHDLNTKLHLAFSCYVFNDKGEFLVTQRAYKKKVWPGVWTNSVCGHPRPIGRTRLPISKADSRSSALGSISDFPLRSLFHRTNRTALSDSRGEIESRAQANRSWVVEPMEDAIKRRLDFELGMNAGDIRVILPKYIYKTPPYNGIIEHEFCPVYIARATSQPKPNLEEVVDFKWVKWEDYVREAEADKTDKYSWWCKDQLKQIKTHPLIVEYSRASL